MAGILGKSKHTQAKCTETTPHLYMHSPHRKVLGTAESPTPGVEQMRARQRDLPPKSKSHLSW